MSEPRHDINLALQGGGAHGAFAWGVLDRLLEEERLSFEGVSATSAGAMNAAVLAQGLIDGDRAAAKELLREFWKTVSGLAFLSPVRSTPFDKLLESVGALPPSQLYLDLITRVMSPYQFNPLNLNPLKEILCRFVDFPRLAADCPLKLFLSATNVRTGKIRVFESTDVTADTVMASACLPFIFQAVEIDGEAYWDGGYMGNPAIFPLIYECESRDVLLVHINPISRRNVPMDAVSILDRVNEISFNASLMREMRAIAFVSDLIDRSQLVDRDMKRMLIHAISAEESLEGLSMHSKLVPEWDLISRLHNLGRDHATAWLGDHFDSLGRTSTVDLEDRYL